ncbi:MAG: metallophosphoesterase [Verrucomicrobiales bacterium]|nr:metallophosphoesterase [Verrucomicrobiales bacterium]
MRKNKAGTLARGALRMVDAGEKSTTTPESPAQVEVASDLWLDARLALVHRRAGWLAVADVHFGYEVARRAAGGLFPLWGRQSIEERFAALLADHRPETVILVGDIVDSTLSGSDACEWLDSVQASCDRLILVAGNHDRGEIRRRFSLVESHLTAEGHFFHHGHQDPVIPDQAVAEVIGHWHPSVSASDGAGLRLRLPSLVQEPRPGRVRWILPAFSPWAGGGRWTGSDPAAPCRQWVCGPGRVFEWCD